MIVSSLSRRPTLKRDIKADAICGELARPGETKAACLLLHSIQAHDARRGLDEMPGGTSLRLNAGAAASIAKLWP